MNPDSEQFEQLRKLLTLKRHEQPPPGYFNRFSDQVIARIKSGETGEKEMTWFRKLWLLLETKPMLTGAFGAAVCALAISGIVFSDDTESPGSTAHNAAAGLTPALGDGMAVMALNQGSESPHFSSSTNPVSPTLRALFDQPQFNLNNRPQPAGFGFPGN